MLEGYSTKIDQDLFDPEKRRLINQLSKILEPLADGYHTYHHRGKYYSSDGLVHTFCVKTDPIEELPQTVRQQVDDFELDRVAVIQDRTIIRQMVSSIIMSCNSLQDFRNCLPECMVPSELVRQYERTAEPGSLLTMPASKKQFIKYLPLMELYSASKFLY